MTKDPAGIVTSPKLSRLQGDPPRRLDRAVVAEHFLHRVAGQRGILAQPRELGRVAQQRERAAAR